MSNKSSYNTIAISEKDNWAVNFLYHTIPGRVILKFLTKPEVSRAAGFVMDSPISSLWISMFIRNHSICLKDYKAEKYRSFNHFFTRICKISTLHNSLCVFCLLSTRNCFFDSLCIPPLAICSFQPSIQKISLLKGRIVPSWAGRLLCLWDISRCLPLACSIWIFCNKRYNCPVRARMCRRIIDSARMRWGIVA